MVIYLWGSMLKTSSNKAKTKTVTPHVNAWPNSKSISTVPFLVTMYVDLSPLRFQERIVAPPLKYSLFINTPEFELWILTFW